MSVPSYRKTTAADQAALMALYRMAFPDEDLRPVVTALLCEPRGVLSLVALRQDRIVGHIVFTRGDTGEDRQDLALLGPLAVHPDHQRKGIGAGLIAEGLQQAEHAGVIQIFVLGDPGYYGKFGFRPEAHVKTPYPLPDDWAPAWQSRLLRPGRDRPQGTLQLPDAWMQPAYWAP